MRGLMAILRSLVGGPLIVLFVLVMSASGQLVPLTKVPEARPWVTVRYLRRLVYERRLPFHKLGAGRNAPVLIDLEDLDRYAQAGRVEAVR